MTPRVLITGASGLIGRMAVKALKEQGYHVVAVCRSGPVSGADQVLHGDLLQDDGRRGVLAQARASHLVHLAWHGAGGNRWNAPENLDWAAATLQLVREFARAGGQRALCVGSCAEYDWSPAVLHESSPLAPKSLYGKAKARTGVLLCESAADLSLSLAWARIFFCYGPGEPKGRLLGDLLTGLRNGEPVDCTDGQQKRDFLHSQDIGAALTAILASRLEGPVNVGSGRAVPVADLINIAAQKMGRPDLIRLGAIQRPADDPALIEADIQRLQSIGFQPKFDLINGIQDCIDQMEPRR